MNISEWLKNARIYAGMTQTQLGDSIGRTRASISHNEKGLSTPPLALIEEIARITGYSLPWEDISTADTPPLKYSDLLNQLFKAIQAAPSDNRQVIASLLSHLALQPSNNSQFVATLTQLLTPANSTPVLHNNMQAEAPAIPSKITFNMQHSTNKKQVINF